MAKKPARKIHLVKRNRFIVVRRYFDSGDDTYKYETQYMTEVGHDYETALALAKSQAETNSGGGCYFVAQLVAKAETVVNVAFEMEEYN